MRAEPWLLLDIGNTAIKWRFGSEMGMGEEGGRVLRDLKALKSALTQCSWQKVAFASVAGEVFDLSLIEWLTCGDEVEIWQATPEPMFHGLTTVYSEPESMGIDRWLSMLAVWFDSNQSSCVIDAGTASTIDIVSSTGQHQGGYIIPGPELMQKVLFSQTARVQVTDYQAPDLDLGHSTCSCVGAGAWAATMGAIRFTLDSFPENRVILTGGNAGALLALGLSCEYRPYLVLEGLRLWLAKQLDVQSR